MGRGQRLKILISCGFTGKSIFREVWGIHEKSQYSYSGNCLKRGAWIVCRFRGEGEGSAKKRTMHFMLDSNH